MFQQFENELNSFMTEKVKEVAGAAEDIFNTAGKLKEQETKIKMLVKTKKTLKKKISVLESQLAEAQDLLKSKNERENYSDSEYDNIHANIQDNETEFENIELETAAEKEKNQTIEDLFTPEQIIYYLETTPEFENLQHEIGEKKKECQHYQHLLTQERETHKQEIEILEKNNTDISSELCKQLQIHTDLNKKIKMFTSSHEDDKCKIEYLEHSRYFWKEYFWMLFLTMISLFAYQFLCEYNNSK